MMHACIFESNVLHMILIYDIVLKIDFISLEGAELHRKIRNLKENMEQIS